MIACEQRQLSIGGLVDGELDAANRASLEAHVRRCARCGKELQQLDALRGMLKITGIRHSAGRELAEKVRRATACNPGPAYATPAVARCFVALLVGLLLGSAILLCLQPKNYSDVEDELITAHVRSLQPGHLVDFETSNRPALGSWFRGKVDFEPPMPALDGQGFSIRGGRLDFLEGRTVAVIVYGEGLHCLNLFVWRGLRAAPRRFTSGGFRVHEWSRGGLRFAAVSDVPEADLRAFERHHRAGPVDAPALDTRERGAAP